MDNPSCMGKGENCDFMGGKSETLACRENESMHVEKIIFVSLPPLVRVELESPYLRLCTGVGKFLSSLSVKDTIWCSIGYEQ
jgi:hypothetical protein